MDAHAFNGLADNELFQRPADGLNFWEFWHSTIPSLHVEIHDCYFASYHVSPVLTSTLRGTDSSTAFSMTSVTTAFNASTSLGGTSKMSSSCTCNSMRVLKPSRDRRSASLTMASLIMSAAVP